MTVYKWLSTTENRKVDFDKRYGYQCVDLFRDYIEKVLGREQPNGVSGAIDLWTGYSSNANLKNVFRQATRPRFGDWLVWEPTKTNKYGHIAMYINDCGNYCLVFEQDGYKQDGAQYIYRTKRGIVGALTIRRPLPFIPEPKSTIKKDDLLTTFSIAD